MQVSPFDFLYFGADVVVRVGHLLMRPKVFREIPINSFAAYRPPVVRFFHPQDTAHYGSDKAGARKHRRRCIAVIKTNMTLSQQAEFAMPMSGSGLVAVRALPMTDAKGAVSAAAADRKGGFDGTTVCGYSHITTVAVRKGAFPGTSAWSPPI